MLDDVVSCKAECDQPRELHGRDESEERAILPAAKSRALRECASLAALVWCLAVSAAFACLIVSAVK